MKPIDFIIILVLLCIIGAVIFYVVREKRKGQKCIGCPYCKSCSGKCGTNEK